MKVRSFLASSVGTQILPTTRKQNVNEHDQIGTLQVYGDS